MYESLTEFRENYGKDTSKKDVSQNRTTYISRKQQEITCFKTKIQTDLLKKYAEVVDTLMEMLSNEKTVCSKKLGVIQDNVDFMNEKRLHLG